MSAPSVVVIGGGWAGCAAAVTLAHAGVVVQLVEAAPVLGGRARRVSRHGLALDNGQHLLLGAYRATRDLVRLLHATPPWVAAPLTLGPWGDDQADAIALRARQLPAPFGLLAGLMGARGLGFGERLATLRWFAALKLRNYRCGDDDTVASLTASLPHAVNARLWHPLCLAALNTPAAVASARVFVNVLRDAFDGHARDTEVLWPQVDLTSLVGDAAAAYVLAHGGQVTTGVRATVHAAAQDRVHIAVGDAALPVRAAIVAVAPHNLAASLAPLRGSADVDATLSAVASLAYEPITTVYVGYAQALPPPAPADLTRLDDHPGQWLIERQDIIDLRTTGAPPLVRLFAVVLSAHGAHETLDHAALAAAVDAQLRRGRPQLPPLAWSQVIAEQRATYACTCAALRTRRALAAMPVPGVHLAGDYMDLDYPATLEAAVRSGRRAAQALLATL